MIPIIHIFRSKLQLCTVYHVGNLVQTLNDINTITAIGYTPTSRLHPIVHLLFGIITDRVNTGSTYQCLLAVIQRSNPNKTIRTLHGFRFHNSRTYNPYSNRSQPAQTTVKQRTSTSSQAEQNRTSEIWAKISNPEKRKCAITYTKCAIAISYHTLKNADKQRGSQCQARDLHNKGRPYPKFLLPVPYYTCVIRILCKDTKNRANHTLCSRKSFVY